MQPIIRDACAADYERLCDLFEEVDACHREHYPRIFQKPEGPIRARELVHDWLADKEHSLFVAQVDGRLVGLLHAAIKTPSTIPILVQRRYVVIENLVVTAGFQRSGVGRALMEKAQAWATREGAESIELNVWEFNHGACAFYESLGYETCTRKMGKWLIQDGNAD